MTIKETLTHFKTLFTNDGDRSQSLTRLYQTLWEILATDFADILDEPTTKRAKTSTDENHLLGTLQSALFDLIANTRNNLVSPRPDGLLRDVALQTTGVHVLEEHDSKTASRTCPDALLLEAHMERGIEFEAKALDHRGKFEGTHRLQAWERALELCNTTLKFKKAEEEDTQYYESEDIDELSNDFQNVSLLDADMINHTILDEATQLLGRFRPSQNTPETLQRILLAKADPNIVLGADGISPLHNVIAFAKKEHVCEMRRLLLEAGVVESDDMKNRWELRCRADASDDAWIAQFHQDPTLVPNFSNESQ